MDFAKGQQRGGICENAGAHYKANDILPEYTIAGGNGLWAPTIPPGGITGIVCWAAKGPGDTRNRRVIPLGKTRQRHTRRPGKTQEAQPRRDRPSRARGAPLRQDDLTLPKRPSAAATDPTAATCNNWILRFKFRA